MKILKILVVLLTVVVVGANVMVILDKGGLDSTPPEITVDSEVLEVLVQAAQEEYLAGVTAWDSRDGDLTDQVMVEHISQLTGENTVKVTYAVFDGAGNAATATRTLKYTDYTGPQFRLSRPLRYQLGTVVTLLDRLTAEDPLDGDITHKMRITSQNLSNDIAGIYHISVQVTNSLGDTQVCSLPVVIGEITENTPEILLTDYIVYLEQGAEFDPQEYLREVTDPADTGSPKRSDVEIQAQVDTSQPGTYDVVYTYEGSKEETQVILTVVVVE